MLNRQPSIDDVFRTALAPSENCPPIEELERCTGGEQAPSAAVAEHVKSCAYCQTELHLLNSFLADDAAQTSDERKAAELLLQRSPVPPAETIVAETRIPWWKAAFGMRGMTQAAFAMAVILAVAGIVVRYRTTSVPPAVNQGSQTGQEVFRSGSFNMLSTTGDLQERPKEIRWEKVPNAVNYQVRLLEVDRNELWNATTREGHIDLPSAVQARIVPAKTLYWQIEAFDSSGAKIGATGLVRFRLLQK